MSYHMLIDGFGRTKDEVARHCKGAGGGRANEETSLALAGQFDAALRWWTSAS
jgi:hypothetical protein